jgi:hypothetical protein
MMMLLGQVTACGVILKIRPDNVKLMLLFKFKDIKASSQMPI